MTDASEHDAAPEPAPRDTGTGRRSKRLRRAARWLRRAALGLGALVGLALLLLQSDRVATAVVQQAAATLNPLDGTELTVRRASGSWIGSLRLSDVTLTRRDTSGARLQMAHVDSLAATYRLWPLLRSELHVTQVTVDSPSVTMRQAADSTWDWARVLPTTTDTTASAWTVRLDRADVRRGGWEARFHAPGRDSTAGVRDLRLAFRDVRVGEALSASIDTLGLRGRVPGDSADVTLAARAHLAAAEVRLDTLRLQSPRSDLRGGGRLVLPNGPGGTLSGTAFRLSATPLSFRDVAALAPWLGLDPAETITLQAAGRGEGRLLRATVDGQFADGGRLAVDAAATPFAPPADTAANEAPGASALRYRLDASVRYVTTSLLGPQDAATNRLTGAVEADLRGPAVSQLSGSVRASIQDTRLYGARADSVRASATLSGGSARVAVGGVLYDAPFSVEGFARPFDRVPTFNLSGRIRNANVAALAPGAGLTSRLAGAVRISGRVAGEGGPNLGLRVDLEPSVVGRESIDRGTLTLRVTPDTLRSELDVATASGSLHVAGRAALDASERFEVREGRIRTLDVAALVGDTTRTSVSGTFEASGAGLTPATMRLDASLALDSTYYGATRLQRFDGSAALRSGRLTAQAEAVLDGGTWQTALEGRPFAETPRFATTQGRFADVDLGALVGDTTQTTRLQGTFDASLRGLTPDEMQLNARVALDTSTVNQSRIDRAVGTVALDRGTLSATLDASLARGRAVLEASGTPFATVPAYRLTEGRLEAIDLGALMGRSGLATSLTGTLSLEGEGLTPETLRLNGDLQLRDSRINRANVPRGRLRLSATGSRALVQADAAVAGGRVQFDAAIDSLAGRPAFNASWSAGALDLGALAGLDSARTVRLDSLRGRVSGSGGSLATLTAEGSVRGRGLRSDALFARSVDLRGRYGGGVLRVDTLDLASNVAFAQGQGTIAVADTTTATRFDMQGTLAGLQPLQPLVGAQRLAASEGRFDVRLRGDPGALAFRGTASLQNLVYNDIRLANLSLSADGEGGLARPLQRVDAEGELGFLSLPGITVEETTLTASYDSSLVDLVATTRLNRTYRARLDATLDPRPGREQVTLTALDARMGSDEWSLLQDATISYADAYRVRNLLLFSGDQQIAADGVIDFNGTQSFLVTAESVRLGPVAVLTNLPGLDGRVGGTIDLTGPAASPRLSSQLRLDIQSEGEAVGTLDLSVAYDSLAATVDARLRHVDGGTLVADGRIPADLRLAAPTAVDLEARPLDLSVAADSFSVGWVDPFLDPALLRDVGGTLSGTVAVGGTRAQPAFSGRATLRDGRAYAPDTEVLYRDAQGTAVFDASGARLEDARVSTDGGGRLTATGTVRFPALTLGAFDLQLTADDFLAIDTRAYRSAMIDGDMTLQGTTQAPVLNGTVQIESADVFFAEATEAQDAELATVRLSEADQLTLEQRFGLRLTEADTTTFDAYEALAMDLTVEIERDTWLRSSGTPEFNIQFTGDLDLTKAPNEDAQVFGSIEVVPGQSTIRQFNQQFSLTEGVLTFNGDPLTPRLSATAVYEQRARQAGATEVTITLQIEGRPDALNLNLSSEPPMDTRNILSYLATGRPAGQLLSGESGGQLATEVALGQATNFVENLAASQLGLDVVRVQIRPNGTSYLTVGRYVTPRLFVSVEQPVARTASDASATSTAFVPDLTLEYQLAPFLLLRVQNQQQSLNLNLLLQYAY